MALYDLSCCWHGPLKRGTFDPIARRAHNSRSTKPAGGDEEFGAPLEAIKDLDQLQVPSSRPPSPLPPGSALSFTPLLLGSATSAAVACPAASLRAGPGAAEDPPQCLSQ
jgi:hypothetical protein